MQGDVDGGLGLANLGLRTRRLVFWQNQLSHHMSELMRCLASDFGLSVVWVVESGSAADRAKMGWPEVDLPGVEVLAAPGEVEMDRLVGMDAASTLHVFSGVFNIEMVREGFQKAFRAGARLALMTEAPLPVDAEGPGTTRGLKRVPGILGAIHRGFRLVYGRDIEAVFCIGGICEDWYRRMGYRRERLVPWGYFPAVPASVDLAEGDGGPVEFLYLGQMSYRKGADLILPAFGCLKRGDWRLTMVGEGPMREVAMGQARELGLEGRVEFVPFLAWGEAMERLGRADYALVPSRHDGWGAVVGEALGRGVPVVCTDRCGSAVVVGSEIYGRVVRAGSVDSLAEGLEGCLADGKVGLGRREAVRRQGLTLSGESVTAYFVESLRALESGRRAPVAPWRAMPSLVEKDRGGVGEDGLEGGGGASRVDFGA